jgi:hypothetical protein
MREMLRQYKSGVLYEDLPRSIGISERRIRAYVQDLAALSAEEAGFSPAEITRFELPKEGSCVPEELRAKAAKRRRGEWVRSELTLLSDLDRELVALKLQYPSCEASTAAGLMQKRRFVAPKGDKVTSSVIVGRMRRLFGGWDATYIQEAISKGRMVVGERGEYVGLRKVQARAGEARPRSSL